MSLTYSKLRRRLGAVLVVVTGFAVVAGAAYSLTGRASSGHETAAPAARAMRADFTARVKALGQSELAPAASSSFTTLTATLSGRSWSFSTYRNEAGDQCIVEQQPGGARGYGCRPRASLFAGGPLFASWGSGQSSTESRDANRWDVAWVEGLTTAAVADVTLVFTDCSTLPLALSPDDSFFAVVGPEHLHAGVLPYRIEAKNAAGRTIASRTVNLGPTSSEAGNIGQPPAVTARDC